MDYHSVSKFWASAERADVTLAGNTLRVIDANTYELKATTDDGTVSMSLVYTQADAPQILASNVAGGSAWEVSSWLAYMPSARVNGWVTVNGQRIDLVDATGYHDHDWGMWFLPGNVWAWAAFSDPSRQLAFDVGLHAAFQKSVAYFRYGDVRLTFPQESFVSNFSDWQSWKVMWKYPRTVTFAAVDSTGQYKRRDDLDGVRQRHVVEIPAPGLRAGGALPGQAAEEVRRQLGGRGRLRRARIFRVHQQVGGRRPDLSGRRPARGSTCARAAAARSIPDRGREQATSRSCWRNSRATWSSGHAVTTALEAGPRAAPIARIEGCASLLIANQARGLGVANGGRVGVEHLVHDHRFGTSDQHHSSDGAQQE